MSKASKKKPIDKLAEKLDVFESKLNRIRSNSNNNIDYNNFEEVPQTYKGAEWEDEWAAELARHGFTKDMLSGPNCNTYSDQIYNLHRSWTEKRRLQIQQQLRERLIIGRGLAATTEEECEKIKQELIAEEQELHAMGGTALEWHELEFKKKLLKEYSSRTTTTTTKPVPREEEEDELEGIAEDIITKEKEEE